LLKQIKLNLQLNKISANRYRLIKADVFETITRSPSPSSILPLPLQAEGGGIRWGLALASYNLILANPPYLSWQKQKQTQKSVRDFEPKQALFAKDKGLFFIKKFLQQAKNYLVKDGAIYLEFDSPQKKEIEKLLKKYNYQNFLFSRDQFNKWRFVKVY